MKQQVIRIRIKFLLKTICVKENESVERKNLHLELLELSLYMVKKHQDSSSVRLSKQPRLKIKKTLAQVARVRARRKAYWKQVKLARKLSAENLAAHNQLQETEKVASPKAPVVSQPENSGCLELTSAVSQSHTHLTLKGKLPRFNWI